MAKRCRKSLFEVVDFEISIASLLQFSGLMCIDTLLSDSCVVFEIFSWIYVVMDNAVYFCMKHC